MSDAHTAGLPARAWSPSTAAPSDARIVRLVAEQARPQQGRADRRPRRRDRLDPAARRRHRRPERGGPARPRHRRGGRRGLSRSPSSPSCSRPATSAPPSSTRRVERGADLLVVGLPYRKRFGGEFAIGRTIPYILQNAPCAVWVVRDPIRGVNVKIVIVGCGRVGASVAETYDRTGHQVVILDIATSAFDRLPATFGGEAHPRRRHRRGRPPPGRRRGRRRLPGPDRGRQPQRHGGPARDRGARHRAGHRQDQRPGAGQGVCRARHRDAVPDRA